jgi:mRNA interferase MazF
MTPSPKRGDIWLIDLDPTKGDELKKQRPGVIVSSDSLGALAVKLIVPVTAWNPGFQGKVWHIQLTPSQINGLTKISSADTLQTRSVSLQRFIKKLGEVEDALLEKIVAALAVVVEV